MKQFFIATALALLLFTGTPTEVRAAFVDPIQWLKEIGTDLLAWNRGGKLTGELVRATTDWANTGFVVSSRTIDWSDPNNPTIEIVTSAGDPTFITNPNEFFKNVSIDAADTFFAQLTKTSSDPEEAFNTLFSGFKDDLLKEVAQETRKMSGTFFENFESDITESELTAYLDNFSAGGWEMFLRTTQNCANNYSCARLAVLSELNSRVNQASTEVRAELEQGGGFLTIRKCVEPSDTEPGGCARYEEVTPGNIIAEQVSRAMTAEFERLDQIDEITEYFIALLEQALSNMIREGLSGLSANFASRNLADLYAQLEDLATEKVDELRSKIEKEQKETDKDREGFKKALEVKEPDDEDQ